MTVLDKTNTNFWSVATRCCKR